MADDSKSNSPSAWPSLMTAKVVGAYCGFSERQCWKLSATNVLPQPVVIPGTRKTLWRKSEIDKFISGLKGAGK